VKTFLHKLIRTKKLEKDVMRTPLNRCLNLFELTLFGVGHMVGAGIFVVTGTIMKNVAGPGVIISYAIAGVAAFLSALCYAELGARVPKAGSSYTYTYVIIGEIIAFIVGWSMVLECVIGAASVARAWSGTLDSVCNGAISNGTMRLVGTINVSWMSEYPDFIALAAVLIVMAFVAAGAQASAHFNTVLTIIKLAVIVFIVALGLHLAERQNWSNFFPFGAGGVIAGAGNCFYAYVGFEGIAVAGEETSNPSRTTPIATLVSVVIATLLYIASAVALSLVVPYYDVNVSAPYPDAFQQRDISWAKYVVGIGSLISISTSLLGSLFSLPRYIYAMARDGVFFRVFAYVNKKTQTPLLSIVVFGLFAGILAVLVDIDVLVELLSIGTLLAFTIVAAAVIVLHYQPVSKCQFEMTPDTKPLINEDGESINENVADSATSSCTRLHSLVSRANNSKANQRLTICCSNLLMFPSTQRHDDIGKLKEKLRSLPVLKSMDPGDASFWAVGLMVIFVIAFWVLVFQGSQYLSSAAWWSILLLIIFGLAVILCYLLLIAHVQNRSFVTFQIPFSPLLPFISIVINIAMMIQLNKYTWLRVTVWTAVGLVIYFAYGIWHSTENNRPSEDAAYPSDNVVMENGVSSSTNSEVEHEKNKSDHEGRRNSDQKDLMRETSVDPPSYYPPEYVSHV